MPLYQLAFSNPTKPWLRVDFFQLGLKASNSVCTKATSVVEAVVQLVLLLDGWC